MQEKNLLRIALLITLLGLLLLFFYTQSVDLETVETLETAEVEKEVEMEGVISQLSVQDKVIFLKLEGKQTITSDIILFSSKPVYLQEGQHVSISGQVEEYLGKKESIADEIIVR